MLGGNEVRSTTLNLQRLRPKLTSWRTTSSITQQRSRENCRVLRLRRWWVDVQDCGSEDVFLRVFGPAILHVDSMRIVSVHFCSKMKARRQRIEEEDNTRCSEATLQHPVISAKWFLNSGQLRNSWSRLKHNRWRRRRQSNSWNGGRMLLCARG